MHYYASFLLNMSKRVYPKWAHDDPDGDFKPSSFTRAQTAALVNVSIRESRQHPYVEPETKHIEYSKEQFFSFLRSFDNKVMNSIIDSLESSQSDDKSLIEETITTLYNKLCESNTKINSMRTRASHLKRRHDKLLRGKRTQNANKSKSFNENRLDMIDKRNEAYRDQMTIQDIFESYNEGDSEAAFRTFYRMHLKVQYDNKDRPKNHKMYPEELHPFYVLLSFVGHYWYDILAMAMDLPSYKTVKIYRKRLLDKYNLSSDTCFDGSVETIQNMKERLWIHNQEGEDDMRCILAIDAASINPQVSIDTNGHITGFTSDGPQVIDIEKANKVRTSAHEYRKFVKENARFVAKYEFVVLLIPLLP